MGSIGTTLPEYQTQLWVKSVTQPVPIPPTCRDYNKQSLPTTGHSTITTENITIMKYKAPSL